MPGIRHRIYIVITSDLLSFHFYWNEQINPQLKVNSLRFKFSDIFRAPSHAGMFVTGGRETSYTEKTSKEPLEFYFNLHCFLQITTVIGSNKPRDLL